MARYTGPVCRICRRHGLKLFLKGERCFGPKCAIERRNFPPGDHGQRRRKLSEYANQLKEKQKSRYIYGVLERQFRKHYATADRGPGRHGRQAAAGAREPAGQRGVPARVRGLAQAGPPARAARPLRPQRSPH